MSDLTEAAVRRMIREEIVSMFGPPAVRRIKAELAASTVPMPKQVARQIDPVMAAIEKAMWTGWNLR